MAPVSVAVVAAVVAVVALVAVLVVLSCPRRMAAEPYYTTWCDNPSLNRLYQSTSGAIAVVPRDPSC